MAVVITATEQDSWPPRVLVDVTGLTPGTSVVLYRVTAGGARTPVRGGAVDPVTDPALLRVDAELPFGEPVSYLAVVDGATEYATPAVTYTLPGGRVALSDAITGQAAEAVILAWPDRRRPRQSSVFHVGGRTVAVVGQLGGAESTVELFVDTTAGVDQLADLLNDATEGVVQIRHPGGYAGVDGHLAVLGYVERRWSQDGTDPRRVLAVDVVDVEPWAPALEAAGVTLLDLADAYTGLTLADLAADHVTLLDLARADLS